MSFHRKILLPTCLFLVLGACSTTPEPGPSLPPPVPENPAILQAVMDLETAKGREAEWQVRLSAGESKTFSLSEILELAQQAQDAGNEARATELAQKVTRFARLGVAQAIDQEKASPYYPQ